MADWYGSTAGTDSRDTHPSASMEVITKGLLSAIKVWVLSAGTYRLSIPEAEYEATASEPGELTFENLNLRPGNRTFTLQTDVPVNVRQLNTSLPYSPAEGITQGQWIEYGSIYYTLPWAFNMEVPALVGSWSTPHDMAGPLLPVSHIVMRRERIPAYQVAGVGDGDSDREVTEGQVWPR